MLAVIPTHPMPELLHKKQQNHLSSWQLMKQIPLRNQQSGKSNVYELITVKKFILHSINKCSMVNKDPAQIYNHVRAECIAFLGEEAASI